MEERHTLGTYRVKTSKWDQARRRFIRRFIHTQIHTADSYADSFDDYLVLQLKGLAASPCLAKGGFRERVWYDAVGLIV